MTDQFRLRGMFSRCSVRPSDVSPRFSDRAVQQKFSRRCSGAPVMNFRYRGRLLQVLSYGYYSVGLVDGVPKTQASCSARVLKHLLALSPPYVPSLTEESPCDYPALSKGEISRGDCIGELAGVTPHD